MRVLKCLASLVIFLSFNGAASAASNADHADCKQLTDIERNIAGCTKIVQDSSESAKDRAAAFTNRGLAYRNKEDYDRALADYTQAIRLDPTSARAYTNRASAYARKRSWDLALADFNEAIKLDPKSSSAYIGRALSHQQIGLSQQQAANARAVADYRKALANANSPEEQEIVRGRLQELGAKP